MRLPVVQAPNAVEVAVVPGGAGVGAGTEGGRGEVCQ